MDRGCVCLKKGQHSAHGALEHGSYPGAIVGHGQEKRLHEDTMGSQLLNKEGLWPLLLDQRLILGCKEYTRY